MAEILGYRTLRRAMQRICPEAHVQRIENLVGVGASDTNFCYKGREVWLELKERIGNKIRVEPSQIPWTNKRLDAGGHVFVLVKWKNDLYLYHGYWLKALSDPSLVDSVPYLAVSRGPRHLAIDDLVRAML